MLFTFQFHFLQKGMMALSCLYTLYLYPIHVMAYSMCTKLLSCSSMTNGLYSDLTDLLCGGSLCGEDLQRTVVLMGLLYLPWTIKTTLWYQQIPIAKIMWVINVLYM